MKLIRSYLWMAVMTAMFFVACSSQRPILEYSEMDTFRSGLQGHSLSLVTLRGINLLDFSSSFESAYGSNQKFASEVMRILGGKIQSKLGQRVQDTLYVDETKDDDSEAKKEYFLRAQLPKLKTDLAIVLTQFEIGQRTEFTQYRNTNSGSSYPSATTTTYSSSEYCQIVIRTEVWDVRKKRKLASFSSLADSQVILWMYSFALTSAVDNSLEQIAGVLNDEVKFKDY